METSDRVVLAINFTLLVLMLVLYNTKTNNKLEHMIRILERMEVKNQ